MDILMVTMLLMLSFFNGLGWGSERHWINGLASVIILSIFGWDVVSNQFAVIGTASGSLIAIAIVAAVLLCVAFWGLGYFVGRRFFRKSTQTRLG